MTHSHSCRSTPPTPGEITYAQNPTQAPRVLSGLAEIDHWIRRRCADDHIYQVIYYWIEADRIMVTEDCRRLDGTSALTASTGRVTDGRSISQSVVRIQNT